ncbi:TadE/TadG family type IV pilus assembly protein, partial [Cellulomonas biazotea]
VGREVGVARTAAPVADPAGAGVAATEARAKRAPGRRQKASDAGSASVELVALLPMIFLVCAILWQLGLTGLTYVWTGYGASEAARAVQLGQSSADVRAATLDAFPSGLRDDVDIRVASPLPSSVDVSVRIPAVVPGLISTPWTAKVEREVVLEP